jgi:hypothetical protein
MSIHASAREATPGKIGSDHSDEVSIHASAREATAGLLAADRDGRVSIHASAREATPATQSLPSLNGDFDPRLRAGGDGAGPSTVMRWPRFDPRLRAGGDAVT